MKYAFEDFVLDDDTAELRRGGETVPIGAQPLALLRHLVCNRDRVVSRHELQERLWQGTAVGETSLGQSVRHARRALGDDGRTQRCIRNVRGRGYRFVAPVFVEHRSRGERLPPCLAAEAPDSSCVGRDNELASLMTSVDVLERRRGDAIWISGEEGVGKTRILQELASRASQRGTTTLRAICGSEVSPSFHPFAEMIAATRHLPAAKASWSGEGSALFGRLCRVPMVSEAPFPRAQEEERVRLFDETLRLFANLALEAPLVLVLDDLHRANSATLAMTHFLALRAEDAGFLFVGSLRGRALPADDPGLAELLTTGSRRAPIHLRGLDEAPLARLLEQFWGRALPPGLPARMRAATGGNPFFARELLRHWLEEGALVDDTGEWNAGMSLDSMSMPAGVREVLSRRLAALDPPTRELLTVASAEDGAFHFEVARRVAQLDEGSGLRALEEALDADLIEATEDAERYRFINDSTRRVLYDEQSPARRVRLHRRLAEAIVTTSGSRAMDHCDRIANHYRRSEELGGSEAGAPYCIAAADRAASVTAWEDEAAWLQTALRLLPPGDPLRFEALQRRGTALAFAGETSEAVRVAMEAASMVEERNGRESAASYLVDVVSAVAWTSSEMAFGLSSHAREKLGRRTPLEAARLRLIELWRDAERSGHPLDTPEHREATVAALENWPSLDVHRKNAMALVGLAFESRAEVLELAPDTAAFLGLWAGRYEEALPGFRAEVDAADTPAQRAGAYFYLCSMARVHAALGRRDEAHATYRESERIRATVPRTAAALIVGASMRSGLVQLDGEGYDALLPVFEEAALELDEGSKWLTPTLMCVGAEVFAQAGRHEEARRMLETGLPALVRSPGWMTSFTLIVNSAIGALWQLEATDWAPLLEEQLRIKTLTPDFRFPSVDARLSMARLRSLQGRHDEAIPWFEEARKVLREQKARPLLAITDLDEVRTRCARDGAGDRERATAVLERAQQEFRALRMKGWLARSREWEAALS